MSSLSASRLAASLQFPKQQQISFVSSPSSLPTFSSSPKSASNFGFPVLSALNVSHSQSISQHCYSYAAASFCSLNLSTIEFPQRPQQLLSPSFSASSIPLSIARSAAAVFPPPLSLAVPVIVPFATFQLPANQHVLCSLPAPSSTVLTFAPAPVVPVASSLSAVVPVALVSSSSSSPTSLPSTFCSSSQASFSSSTLPLSSRAAISSAPRHTGIVAPRPRRFPIAADSLLSYRSTEAVSAPPSPSPVIPSPFLSAQATQLQSCASSASPALSKPSKKTESESRIEQYPVSLPPPLPAHPQAGLATAPHRFPAHPATALDSSSTSSSDLPADHLSAICHPDSDAFAIEDDEERCRTPDKHVAARHQFERKKDVASLPANSAAALSSLLSAPLLDSSISSAHVPLLRSSLTIPLSNPALQLCAAPASDLSSPPALQHARSGSDAVLPSSDLFRSRCHSSTISLTDSDNFSLSSSGLRSVSPNTTHTSDCDSPLPSILPAACSCFASASPFCAPPTPHSSVQFLPPCLPFLSSASSRATVPSSLQIALIPAASLLSPLCYVQPNAVALPPVFGYQLSARPQSQRDDSFLSSPVHEYFRSPPRGC